MSVRLRLHFIIVDGKIVLRSFVKNIYFATMKTEKFEPERKNRMVSGDDESTIWTIQNKNAQNKITTTWLTLHLQPVP